MSKLRARILASISVIALVASALIGVAGRANADSPPPTTWLCKPGMANDPCTPSLTTTVYSNTGKVLGVKHVHQVPHPKIDCFYVYPTVSDQKTPAADFTIDPVLRSIALYQAARYSSECRVFAPVYRQITLSAASNPAAVTPALREQAYQDVRNAWLDYLAHYNHGRGVVFIGHSQGSGDLERLLAEEVDPNPALRSRLVSAIILGGNVTVKKGSDRGGVFQNIPACRSSRQFGCVVAFSTFDAPVPANSGFGRTTDPSLQVLCTNPASLAGGSAPVDSVYPTQPFAPGSIAAVTALLGQPPITATTPWVEVRDSYEATCSSADGANVLQVTPLGASPLLHEVPDATFGLHLVDGNIALGNLVSLVRTQALAWQGHHHGGNGQGQDQN
jgi:hypothetical protein